MEWTSQGQAKLAAARRAHTDALDAIARNDLQKARRLYVEALRLRQQTLPPSDLKIIATLDMFAQLLVTMGDKAKAIDILRDLRRLQIQRLGPSHFDVERTSQRLVTLLYDAGGERKQQEIDEITAAVWKARTLPPQERASGDVDAALGTVPLPASMVTRLQSASSAMMTPITTTVSERHLDILSSDWDPMEEYRKAKEAKAEGRVYEGWRPKPRPKIAEPPSTTEEEPPRAAKEADALVVSSTPIEAMASASSPPQTQTQPSDAPLLPQPPVEPTPPLGDVKTQKEEDRPQVESSSTNSTTGAPLSSIPPAVLQDAHSSEQEQSIPV